jgi:hypothetical protein
LPPSAEHHHLAFVVRTRLDRQFSGGNGKLFVSRRPDNSQVSGIPPGKTILSVGF